MEDSQFVKNDKELLDCYRKYVSSKYADFLERTGLAHTVRNAKGAVIQDSRGKMFLDFVAGYGIFNLGHNHPKLIRRIRSELNSNPLWNRPFINQPLVDLSLKLAKSTSAKLSKVFICSTGAEAIDSSIKLARLATGRIRVIAATGAFHGFTLGALSVCGLPSQRRAYEPLLPGIGHVPFGDTEAMMTAVTRETAAVLLEPIQAEIGGDAPPEGYFESVRKICDKAGALLIIDEVRTAVGRTGPFLAIERERITPDILALGKSLAGGIVPIGAMLARPELWGRFDLAFSMTASSFAGNRLSCISAIETLDIIENENILGKGLRNASLLWGGLEELKSIFPALIEKISGKGLLIGVHFRTSSTADQVVQSCISQGLLVAKAFCNNRCLLIEPPLILKQNQVVKGLEILRTSCEKTRRPYRS